MSEKAFRDLDPVLHVQQRLGVVSILVSVEEADFVYIRKAMGMTAGNLSSHLDKLCAAGYVEVVKTIEGKRPRSICRLTPDGLVAFENYVESLRAYLKI
ncbi:MAG: transcriptional regulator [Tannerellaceae bacterium]|jgi:DNA-binding MarR family transcriptional regulator|nr:transcriptional regulator [Tannerellaceae bacterium]